MFSIFKNIHRRPVVAVSIAYGRSFFQGISRSEKWGADVLEIRWDTFPRSERKNIPNYLKKIELKRSLSLISTVRSPREQGLKPENPDWTDSERNRIFETVLPYSDLIDIELSSKKIQKHLIELAHQNKKKVILSYHDFNHILTEKKISKLVQDFKSLNGDILKIAGTPKSISEVRKMLWICANLDPIPRIFVLMGELGKISRVLGYSFGSCLTYACLDQPLAPGQIPIRELNRELKGFYS